MPRRRRRWRRRGRVAVALAAAAATPRLRQPRQSERSSDAASTAPWCGATAGLSCTKRRERQQRRRCTARRGEARTAASRAATSWRLPGAPRHPTRSPSLSLSFCCWEGGYVSPIEHTGARPTTQVSERSRVSGCRGERQRRVGSHGVGTMWSSGIVPKIRWEGVTGLSPRFRRAVVTPTCRRQPQDDCHKGKTTSPLWQLSGK